MGAPYFADRSYEGFHLVEREKEIARWAFDTAYQRECATILDMARTMASTAREPADLWRIHDYLDEQRASTDEKYDYRYSMLIMMFARLIGITRNAERDRQTTKSLMEAGWRVLVVWECAVRGPGRLPEKSVLDFCESFVRTSDSVFVELSGR